MPLEKSILSREKIVAALQRISDELGGRGVKGELCLFGGGQSWFSHSLLECPPKTLTREIRDAARKVGAEFGFADHWLNDAAKGFVSARHEVKDGNLPQFPNLRLTMPTAEYLLAMKCLASRIGAVETDADDVNDIIFLIKHLKLKDPAAVMDLASSYYPDRIPVKTQYLVEGLFEEGKI